MDEKFNLVFSGELARGADPASAKKNLGALFNISGEQVEKLFSGKRITLKKNLDFDTANKYRVAIKKAGCIAEVSAIEQKPAEQEKKPKAVFVTDAPAGSAPVSEAATPEKPSEDRAVNNSHSAPEKSDDSGLSLAPTGSSVLQESEREQVLPQQVATEHLSLAQSGENLLKPEEKTEVPALDIAVNAELAPVGSDLLSEQEKESVESIKVDVSALSLAEAGADLEQINDEKVRVNPDVSHLSLE